MNSEQVSNYTDCYFTKSKEAAVYADLNPKCLWQVFQKQNVVLAGMGLISKFFYDGKVDRVDGLTDGTELMPGEAALLIRGDFQSFVEFETVYLGILARCTRIATNVRKAVKAANGKPVLFFPARFDVPETQYYDGYAAAVGGVTGCATQEQTNGFNLYRLMKGLEPKPNPVGTMPHALIAACGGDTVEAALAFAYSRPGEDCWVLVDFHNDCAKTAVEVYNAFQQRGLKLAGVRLDTSEKLADEGIVPKAKEWGIVPPTGVCPQLVRHVREQLDAAGAKDVRIAVSGGFTPEKIKMFESSNVPADVYAVGEGFLKGSTPFTSDIVVRFDKDGNHIPSAKVGRGLQVNPRLQVLYSADTMISVGAQETV